MKARSRRIFPREDGPLTSASFAWDGATVANGGYEISAGFEQGLLVSGNGWAEGECRGKAGWFPYGYIERRDRVLASKIAEAF